MWYPSMQYERYYVISDDNEDTSGQKRRFKMWVTDAIYMPNCQKIAISSTSRDIRFFDTSTSQYFEEYHLFGKYLLKFCVSVLLSIFPSLDFKEHKLPTHHSDIDGDIH